MSISAQCASIADRPDSFQLKGALFPMQLLDLKSTDLAAVQKELQAKVVQSPAFFNQSPIVFGFEQLSEADQNIVDIQKLCEICQQMGLVPTATRGGNPKIQGACKALGLAILPKGRSSKTAEIEVKESATQVQIHPAQPEKQENADTPVRQSGAAIPTKVVSTPIRSGQQIYAPGGDLIILSSVSAGAEVLADGNIHIYGALRGRALAGVQGNEDARIFCSSQEAELVSIAGQFLVDENLRETHWREAVQICLRDGRLYIAPRP